MCGLAVLKRSSPLPNSFHFSKQQLPSLPFSVRAAQITFMTALAHPLFNMLYLFFGQQATVARLYFLILYRMGILMMGNKIDP